MWNAADRKPDFSDAQGKRILIALSGGADSVALTLMLHEARGALGLTLCAAHVDHGIRPESVADAAFCRDLCADLGIPFHSVRIDVPEEARARHEGIESVARRLRHAALEDLRIQSSADCIALAHHMDDQAETVLMHLARGTGPEGIGGMSRWAGRLYRPLLDWRKAELVDCLQARGARWREDATNQLDDNPRNTLRLRIIPEMERLYPGFAASAARYARSAQIEDDYLREQTERWLARHSGKEPHCTWLALEPVPHPALLRRALRLMAPRALSFDQVGRLEALCSERRGKLDLGKGRFAERTGGRLYFVAEAVSPAGPVPLSCDGVTVLPGLAAIAAKPWPPVPVRDDPFRQVLKRSALAGAVVRTRRAGDRIRPLGCGEKLLSDYFTDRKVDRPLRDGIPLIAAGRRILWVCGHGIAQEAAVSEGDDALLLRCEMERR